MAKNNALQNHVINKSAIFAILFNNQKAPKQHTQI